MGTHTENQALSQRNVDAFAKEVEGYLERVTLDKYVYIHGKALELYKKTSSRIVTVHHHGLVVVNITKGNYAWSFIDRKFVKKYPGRLSQSISF